MQAQPNYLTRTINKLSSNCTAETLLYYSTSDVGHVGHEVATANEAEDCYTVVLVQDTQRAQHLA